MTFFWLQSDRETVKVISWQKWQEIAGKDYGRERFTRLICDVCNGEIHFLKGKNFIAVPRAQLQAVLLSKE